MTVRQCHGCVAEGLARARSTVAARREETSARRDGALLRTTPVTVDRHLWLHRQRACLVGQPMSPNSSSGATRATVRAYRGERVEHNDTRSCHGSCGMHFRAGDTTGARTSMFALCVVRGQPWGGACVVGFLIVSVKVKLVQGPAGSGPSSKVRSGSGCPNLRNGGRPLCVDSLSSSCPCRAHGAAR